MAEAPDSVTVRIDADLTEFTDKIEAAKAMVAELLELMDRAGIQSMAQVIKSNAVAAVVEAQKREPHLFRKS